MWRRLDIFTQFSVAFSAVLVALMLALGIWVGHTIAAQAEETAAEETALFLQGLIQPLLSDPPASDILSEDAIEALEKLLPRHVLHDDDVLAELLLLRLWTPDGELLFASTGRIEPVIDPVNYVKRAVKKGIVSAFRSLEATSQGIADEHVLAVFAPLYRPVSGEVAAVVESYQNEAFALHELHDLRWKTWSLLAATTGLLLLSLHVMWLSASHTIGAQRVDLVARLAEARALARENAGLKRAVEASRQHIAQSNDRYLERIGADIHDGPIQTLTVLLMSLDDDSESEDDEARQTRLRLARMAHDELRALSQGLILPNMATDSLRDAILEAIAEHEQKTDTRVRFACRNSPETVAPAIKIGAYRIVQEALNNAWKHAGGIDQRVGILATTSHLRIVVTDKGPGFDADGSGGGRLGLVGMRNRTAALRGLLKISRPGGRGTRICVDIPLDPGD